MLSVLANFTDCAHHCFQSWLMLLLRARKHFKFYHAITIYNWF